MSTQKYYIAFLAIISIIFSSCSTSIKQEVERLNSEIYKINTLLKNIQDLPTYEDAIQLIDNVNNLKVIEKISQKKGIDTLIQRVDSAKTQFNLAIEELIPTLGIILDCQYDHIIEKGSTFIAKKLNKGDLLTITFDSALPMNVTIHNMDTKKVVKQSELNIHYIDSFVIPNTAIYLVELNNPNLTQYISYEIIVNCNKLNSFLSNFDVAEKEISASSTDYLAYSRDEYGLINLYEEPRQYTLRGGWKSTFGGHKRTILPLNIPPNTVNVAYQLRIDTSAGVASSDGEFYSELSNRCSTVKILGTTVREKNESHTSLLREILNNMKTPKRVEEAYCSMYVFYDENAAREFVNTGNTTLCDINYSLISTQSCNGNIPLEEHDNIYLGFENDQFSGSIYLWIEAIATTTQTNYYKKQYLY